MADDDSPGWEAIDQALGKLYGPTPPLHFGSDRPPSLGGPPLEGISVYPVGGPAPYWHLISYGLTELHSKVSDNQEWSGWGLELSMRLRVAPGEQQPPGWAMMLLQNLADYVFKSKRVFEPGQTVDFKGPMTMDKAPTMLTCAFFAVDPQLGQINTPHGKVIFLSVTGILAHEIPLAKADPKAFQARLANGNPNLVIDLARKITPPEAAPPGPPAPPKRKNPFGFE